MPLKPALETRLATLDAAAAAEALVRGYGPEVLSFLHSLLANDDDAAEAFAMFSEDVWRGFAGFRRECSFRTWSYLLARNAAQRLRISDERRRRRFVADHDDGGDGGERGDRAERVAHEVRTTTAAFRRTATKDAVRALRDELPDADRELLELRVDRGLDWREVGVVVGVDAATVRKRFERIKEKLRVKAQRAGLIPD